MPRAWASLRFFPATGDFFGGMDRRIKACKPVRVVATGNITPGIGWALVQASNICSVKLAGGDRTFKGRNIQE